ncbi:hypothetical protein [Arthrobacter sp. S39]|uniref:hypothetical protein n=1 Tax=Arthrobacter sp. S39 TaxID=2509720 RepID=UPI001F5EAEF5|nr:hypothetical protein [Arthrobacter sp. S39]
MHDSLQQRARRTPAALRRRSVLVAAAGFLAIVLIAAAYTLAHVLPWPGSASRAATGADSRAGTARIDAGLDTAINGIIGANGEYQGGLPCWIPTAGTCTNMVWRNRSRQRARRRS